MFRETPLYPYINKGTSTPATHITSSSTVIFARFTFSDGIVCSAPPYTNEMWAMCKLGVKVRLYFIHRTRIWNFRFPFKFESSNNWITNRDLLIESSLNATEFYHKNVNNILGRVFIIYKKSPHLNTSPETLINHLKYCKIKIVYEHKLKI